MSQHFFEIVFTNGAFAFSNRSEVEDDLECALNDTGVGEIVGAGYSIYGRNIDIKANDFQTTFVY